ncbi:hypothetical protein ACL07V_28520 [Streptomyces sp. MB22_4]|uniref:hypothetical protein n=1 Tax=Streptomyces sp. MB22_4 TaxID=3383120 RepID=UPI0039A283B3
MNEGRVAAERAWVLDEVDKLVAPVLARGGALKAAIVDAFAEGRSDIPFSASRHARSEIVPGRDLRRPVRRLVRGGRRLDGRAGVRSGRRR